VGEVPGHLRAIVGIFPANDSPSGPNTGDESLACSFMCRFSGTFCSALRYWTAVQTSDGRCHGLNCGSDTFAEALPACPAGLLNTQIGNGTDTENDGCVDPYTKDQNNLCSVAKDRGNLSAPKLVQLETMCVLPGTTKLTAQLMQLLEKNKVKPEVGLNQCEQCGRESQVPCPTNDFGGCFVNEGFIKDPNSVRFQSFSRPAVHLSIAVPQLPQIYTGTEAHAGNWHDNVHNLCSPSGVDRALACLDRAL
jgi:hypothetical protein